MSDIVKKYQHYFAESTRLQEMVNEQAAYIAELEEAVLALSEDYFDSDEASAASRGNIKAAEKAVAAGKKPADFIAKVKAKHGKMKKSPYAYGIKDDVLDAKEFDNKPIRSSPTAQVPIVGKALSGYDARYR
jgi:hypothetical protein